MTEGLVTKLYKQMTFCSVIIGFTVGHLLLCLVQYGMQVYYGGVSQYLG
jgi:uncharacterized membrane protein YwzB